MTTYDRTLACSDPALVCANVDAKRDFRKANLRGHLNNIIATLTGRPSRLLDLDRLTKGKEIQSRSYAGTHNVNLDQIQGSEGRSQDFDPDFNPLKSHCCNRWISVALAWQYGICLPAVDLIKVGDVYIVRDGHHRISVARYMGAKFIDAHITEWVLV